MYYTTHTFSFYKKHVNCKKYKKATKKSPINPHNHILVYFIFLKPLFKQSSETDITKRDKTKKDATIPKTYLNDLFNLPNAHNQHAAKVGFKLCLSYIMLYPTTKLIFIKQK